MFEELYSFENIKINKISVGDTEILISGSLSEDSPKCPCGSHNHQYLYKYETFKVRDWNIGNKNVILVLEVAWYKCGECDSCYRATSKDLNTKHRLTERMFKYIGELSVTESYKTVSLISNISTATIGNIYISYIKELIFDKQYKKRTKLIIGETIVKSTYCKYIADADNFELLYLIPDCNMEELEHLLSEWYKDEAPEVIYCYPDVSVFCMLSDIFCETELVIDEVALRNIAFSTMVTYKRKYKVSANFTDVLEGIVSKPYDERFMSKYEWVRALVAMTNRYAGVHTINEHIAKGCEMFSNTQWIPYRVFERFPELLQKYYRNPLSATVKKKYLEFIEGVRKTDKCKTLQRAIDRLIYAKDMAAVHNKKENKDIYISSIQDPYYRILDIWKSEKYKKLDEYHRLELLKQENPKLFDEAIRIF